jgi:hypothetical protein
MLTRSKSFGPTCRLASSPKVGPGATVGTLKLGYPLLLYKDTVPTRLSLSRVVKVLCVGPDHDLPQSWAATLGPQRRPTPPHGRVRSRHMSREGDILQGVNSGPDPHGRASDPRIYSPDPQGWSRASTCASRTPGMGSGPPPPPYGVRAAHNGVPRFQDRTYSCLNQDPGGVGADTCPDLIWLSRTLLLPAQAETRCYHVAYCMRHKPMGGT